jgi:hypothetical protein
MSHLSPSQRGVFLYKTLRPHKRIIKRIINIGSGSPCQALSRIYGLLRPVKVELAPSPSAPELPDQYQDYGQLRCARSH